MIEQDFQQFLDEQGKQLLESYINHRRLFQKMKNEFLRRNRYKYTVLYDEDEMRHMFRSWYSSEYNKVRVFPVCPGGKGGAL